MKQSRAAESATNNQAVPVPEIIEESVLAGQLRNASNGMAHAQYELGLRYHKGDGVPADWTIALHWLKSACTNGHSQASNALATLIR